jgi:hypothetical protein
MTVAYVKVYQGSGGSHNTDFSRGSLRDFASAALTLTNGQSVQIGANTLALDANVALVTIKNSAGSILDSIPNNLIHSKCCYPCYLC